MMEWGIKPENQMVMFGIFPAWLNSRKLVEVGVIKYVNMLKITQEELYLYAEDSSELYSTQFI